MSRHTASMLISLFHGLFQLFFLFVLPLISTSSGDGGDIHTFGTKPGGHAGGGGGPSISGRLKLGLYLDTATTTFPAASKQPRSIPDQWQDTTKLCSSMTSVIHEP